MTSDDDMELIHGSGNVFRDFGDPNADVLQLKANLAAKIIGVLDDEGLTVRKAEEITGFSASDFSRIRNVKLERFTIDRMVAILGKLHQDVELSVTVHSPSPRALSDRSARWLKLMKIQSVADLQAEMQKVARGEIAAPADAALPSAEPAALAADIKSRQKNRGSGHANS